MRGRPRCPTEQEKKPVGATVSNPPFYKERLGTGSPLIRPSVRTGAPSPKGKAFGLGVSLSDNNIPPPARPAGGRAVTGVGIQGRRPGRKKEDPRRVPPKLERWVQGGRTSSSLVFSSGFLPKKAGLPAGVGGGNHVAGPTLRRSRRSPNGGPAGSPRPRKSPDHGKGPYPGAGPFYPSAARSPGPSWRLSGRGSARPPR